MREKLDKATVLKFVGLLVFFTLMVVAVVLAWPRVSAIFEEGGLELLIATVKEAGGQGVLLLLGLQFIQIVVAFLPGEITQIAAGMIYGPWLGALILLVGCVLSSAFVFVLVHRLGAPFVQSMVPTSHLESFRKFEESGKLNVLVFVLFLIPGLPKDVFTYLVPLTDMRMRTFLLLSNVGRIPAILITTYAADGLVEGRFWQSAVIFIVAALVAAVGILSREKIMALVNRLQKK